MRQEKLYVRSGQDDDGARDFIRSLGGDPDRMAAVAGLDYSVEDSGVHLLDWSRVCHYFELGAEMCNEPNFGLIASMNTPDDLRNIGPIAFMGFVTDNLRSLIDILLPYLDTHTNGVKFEVKEDEATNTVMGVITLHPLSPPCRQYFNHIMGTASVLAHRHVPNFKLDYVTFQHDAPEDMTMYNEVFKCPVYFNADQNTLVTHRKFLGKEHKPPILKVFTPILQSYLDWRKKKLARPPKTMTEVVVEILPTIMGAMNSDAVSMANTLQIHPKKLQRLLAEEGTHYSEVLDEVRKNIAHRLLSESDMSITRLARLLDYSSDRPFTNAAKRWWGLPPSKYRRTLQQGQVRKTSR
jgi:AraC-like DNA-binding protein